MKIIKITAKSSRGKNAIKNHGTMWAIVEWDVVMPCFSGYKGHQIRAVETGEIRNIRASNDEHFIILEISE